MFWNKKLSDTILLKQSWNVKMYLSKSRKGLLNDFTIIDYLEERSSKWNLIIEKRLDYSLEPIHQQNVLIHTILETILCSKTGKRWWKANEIQEKNKIVFYLFF